MKTEYFSIAGIKIALRHNPELYDILLDRSLNAFITGHFENQDMLFKIDASSAFPSPESYRRIFTSNPEGLWTIYEDNKKSRYLISLQNIGRDEAPYKIAMANRDFTDFIIHTRPVGGRVSPLEYPFDELAISGHININRIGILLHSACISFGGKGYLFSGVSGSGKSTISEIWQKDKDVEVLTDERVIIREIGNDLWAFGTPWHGTAGIHKNMGAPIENIFFIKHGTVNRARPISKTDAANRLMVRCFPTFWSREGMEFAVDFCIRIAQETECYDLEFIPDLSVTDYVKGLD